eukprot:EG_transcript_1998
MALALAYPVVCYAARQSCSVMALHDAFVWAVPVSFCWVLCDGALGALKWIWGIHFATIIILTSLTIANVWQCPAPSPLPGTSVSGDVFAVFAVMLAPQGLCVVAATLCFRQHRRHAQALQGQINVALQFLDTLERFALHEAPTISMDLEVPLHVHLIGVLDQLNNLKPFLPHTLFAPDTDSYVDSPPQNPLDRPPARPPPEQPEPPTERRRASVADGSDTAGSPSCAGLTKVPKRLRLEPCFFNRSANSSPAFGDCHVMRSPRPEFLRTPGSARPPALRRMSQVTAYESLTASEPKNPFAFDTDREFLDVVSGVPSDVKNMADTPKLIQKGPRWNRRRHSSRGNAQGFLADAWCRSRDSLQPERKARKGSGTAEEIPEPLGMHSIGAEEDLDGPASRLATPPAAATPQGRDGRVSKAGSPRRQESLSPHVHTGCLLQRTITLLYVNLCNINDIARKHCSQVEGLLDVATTILFDVVTQNRGTVVTFSGGRLLASWNAASRIPLHAQKAGQCALQMHEELGKLAGSWTKAGIRVSARIAIATCPATFGHVGRLHASYNVLGPGLGVVQALDQLCKHLRLRTVLTDVSHDLCKYMFQMRPVDVVRLELPGCDPVQTKVYELQGLCAETGAGEEWMYEMQERNLLEEKDFDRGFHLLCEGDLLGAQLLFEMQAKATPADPTVLRLLRLCEYFRDHPEGRRLWRPPYVRRLVGPWQQWGPEEADAAPAAHSTSVASATPAGSFHIHPHR